MTLKDKIINEIIEIEGGYVNNPNDSGGATKYGITEEVARNNGYTGEMFNLPYELAFKIYSTKYWDSVRADDMPDKVAAEVVDTAVNMGVKRAVSFLQRSLNLVTDNQLMVDGIIGSATIGSLNSYMSHRGDETTLVKMLNSLQGAYYIALAERREKDRTFIYGWFKNRI